MIQIEGRPRRLQVGVNLYEVNRCEANPYEVSVLRKRLALPVLLSLFRQP